MVLVGFQEYLKKHGVARALESALDQLARERPDDPLALLANALGRKTPSSTATAVGPRGAVTVAAAVRRSEESEQLFQQHQEACEKLIKGARDRMQRCERMETVSEVLQCAAGSGSILQNLVKEVTAIGKEGDASGRSRRGQQNKWGDGMVASIDVDRGVTDFFSSASLALETETVVKSALEMDSERYLVCEWCRSGILKSNTKIHAKNCAKIVNDPPPEGSYAVMTADWAIKEAERGGGGRGKEAIWVAMYCLNSPLCFEVNRRMRNLAFLDRTCDADTQIARKDFVDAQDFAFHLHRELTSLPKYEGTVFRAVDFKVSESLYSKGS
eukprot:Hpha_TRINITY_DN16938_c2_g2::TRINITY_DN16938_c2_g2_i1::g.56810::m.56810